MYQEGPGLGSDLIFFKVSNFLVNIYKSKERVLYDIAQHAPTV